MQLIFTIIIQMFNLYDSMIFINICISINSDRSYLNSPDVHDYISGYVYLTSSIHMSIFVW